MTDDRGRGRRRQQIRERTQDFLMPGLRHAHTLQQLKSLFSTHPRESIKNKSKERSSQNNDNNKKEINDRRTRNNKS